MPPRILLSDGLPFVVSRALIHEVGLEEALVLQQVHYWCDPKRNQNLFHGKYWVHNTYKQWQKQFSFWNLKKIQRVFNTLERCELLVSFTQQTNCHKTKFYTINYERLSPMRETPCVFSCPENGMIVPPKLSPGEDRNDHRSGQNLECEKENAESKIQEFQGIQPWDRNGTTIIPKVGGSRDKIGCIDDPKNVLSYKLITETTKTENPPPLTPPSNGLPSQRQEEKEKSKTDKREESSESTFFQQMVDAWNQQVQSQLYPGSQALLTPQRVTRMTAFVKETAISDLASWERYCQQISSSRFLRGENGWLLGSGTASRSALLTS